MAPRPKRRKKKPTTIKAGGEMLNKLSGVDERIDFIKASAELADDNRPYSSTEVCFSSSRMTLASLACIRNASETQKDGHLDFEVDCNF